MQLEFSNQEKNYLILILNDVLKASQTAHDRPASRLTKRFLNKFYGQGIVNLKLKELVVLGDLVDESLTVLTQEEGKEENKDKKENISKFIDIGINLEGKLHGIVETKSKERLEQLKKLSKDSNISTK